MLVGGPRAGETVTWPEGRTVWFPDDMSAVLGRYYRREILTLPSGEGQRALVLALGMWSEIPDQEWVLRTAEVVLSAPARKVCWEVERL